MRVFLLHHLGGLLQCIVGLLQRLVGILQHVVREIWYSVSVITLLDEDVLPNRRQAERQEGEPFLVGEISSKSGDVFGGGMSSMG